MIKNIIFDMSEVIISGYHGIEKILENKKNILTEVFKKQFFSFETGMLKKDDGYFKYILNESNINQNETIFIDDYKSNVQKAQECDINGIVFTNAKDLEKELHKKYNINL